MKLKNLVILVLILLLLCQSFAQRGGGGRSRSRSSRSSRFSRSKGKSGGGYHVYTVIAIVIYLLYLILMWIYGVVRSFYRCMRYGNNQFRRIGDSYIKRYRGMVNKLNQKQVLERVELFVEKTWIISYKNSYCDRKYFDFKIDKFTKKSDYVYEFTGTGSNEKQLGNSKMVGIVLFHNDKFNLCFQKIYDDKQKAGQQEKDRWDMLIYEVWERWNGFFQGKWFYENFEKDPSFSGLLEMRETPGK